MKFLIDSTAFVRTGEISLNGENIPLKTVQTRRALFLKKNAEELLQVCDVWRDFDKAFAVFSAEKRSDLMDGLTLLRGFGIAECREDPVHSNVRVAGERDYRGIAALIDENPNDGIGWLPPADKEVYQEDLLRARQFMNTEYHFLYEKDGKMRGMAVLVMPKPETLSVSVILGGTVFERSASEEEKRHMLLSLLSFAAKSFADEFRTVRFLQRYPESEPLTSALCDLGFRCVCTLKKEMPFGEDVAVYDMPIRSLTEQTEGI